MKKVILLLIGSSVYMYAVAQPANDDPCGAISIPIENLGCEPTTTYSWTGATFNAAYGNTYCNGFQNMDVWYKFTVPANGEINARIATANTSNMCAEFYTSSSCNAGALTIFNQSNNGFPCMYTSGSSGGDGNFKNLVPGTTVYIRVFALYSNSVANASLKICITNTSTLADEPCNAGLFPVDAADPLGQGCTPFKVFSWTGATLTPAIPNPCYASTPSFVRDVWFKVRVPASGKLDIRFENNPPYSGQAIAVYNATACNGIFTEIYCSFVGNTFTGLTPNSIIYCRVYSYSSAIVENGSIKICVADFNSVPTVNNTGKIGIGIDTPFAKLDVVGTGIFRDKLTAASDVEVRGNLILKGNIISKYGSSLIQGNTTIQGGPLAIDSLDIGSRLGNRVSLYGGLGNSPKYGFGIQGGTLQMYSDAAASNLAFGYGNSYNFTERARIINQGEFGMTLKGRLQLSTGTQSAGLWLTNAANTVNTSFIGMQSDNLVGLYGATGAGWGLAMNTTTGNVGIGMNGVNPTVPLQFSNALGLTKISLYKGTYGDVGIGAYGGELRLQNDIPNGKVSLGVIETTGAYTELAKAQKNGAIVFSVLGNLWANGTTYPSDGRFKKNIQPLQHSLEKILQLQGVSYEMKTDEFPTQHFDTSTQVGLIAQDVEKLIPQVVSEGPNGYKAIDYAKLVPLLIESIKALKQEINDLKIKVNKLEINK